MSGSSNSIFAILKKASTWVAGQIFTDFLQIDGASPRIKLNDGGNIAVINGNSGGLDYDTVNSSKDHFFRAGGTTQMRLYGDNGLAVGNTTETIRGGVNAEALHINGQDINEQLQKVQCNFNGSGVVSINSSFNVLGVTDVGTGDYDVNLDVPFANANFYPNVNCVRAVGLSNDGSAKLREDMTSASKIQVRCTYNDGTLYDPSKVIVIASGEQ